MRSLTNFCRISSRNRWLWPERENHGHFPLKFTGPLLLSPEESRQVRSCDSVLEGCVKDKDFSPLRIESIPSFIYFCSLIFSPLLSARLLLFFPFSPLLAEETGGTNKNKGISNSSS